MLPTQFLIVWSKVCLSVTKLRLDLFKTKYNYLSLCSISEICTAIWHSVACSAFFHFYNKLLYGRVVERQALPSHPHRALTLSQFRVTVTCSSSLQHQYKSAHLSVTHCLASNMELLTCSTYLGDSARKPCLSLGLITLSLLCLSKNLLCLHVWNLWIKITCILCFSRGVRFLRHHHHSQPTTKNNC